MAWRSIKTLLFVPAHRSQLIEKAYASGADAVILDIEDSVPAGLKEEAREHLSARRQGTCTIVRVNSVQGDDILSDLSAAVEAGVDGVLLPKVTRPTEVSSAMWYIERFSRSRASRQPAVFVSLESAESIWEPTPFLDCGVTGLMAGAPRGADVSSAIGFRWTAGGLERLTIEARAVLAGRAAGLEAIWAFPWLDLDDDEGLRTDTVRQRDLGYTGRAVIHPGHLDAVQSVFEPTAEEISDLKRIVAALEKAEEDGKLSVRLDGRMVDAAHLEYARERLSAIGELGRTLQP